MDCIVVGAGISGLCVARRVLMARPDAKVAVLERASRAGGRAHDATFRGVLVHEGAGVGRMGRDKLLAALLKELGLMKQPFRAARTKAPESIMRFVRELRAAQARRGETFGAFARRVLNNRYADFENAVGYSDFQGAGVKDTLDDYGFEFPDSDSFVVPWNDLVAALVRDVRARGGTVTLNVDVRSASSSGVVTDRGVIKAKVVVLAVPPCRATDILNAPLLKRIGINRFVRGYAEVDLGSAANVAAFKRAFPAGKMTPVPGPLQKIAPLKIAGNVVVMLCAYADSQRAAALVAPEPTSAPLNVRPGTKQIVAELRDVLSVELQESFSVTASKAVAACPGTHYFKPLPAGFADRDAFLTAARRPRPGVFVVGEAMSRTQGWTEGALESVEAVIREVISW